MGDPYSWGQTTFPSMTEHQTILKPKILMALSLKSANPSQHSTLSGVDITALNYHKGTLPRMHIHRDTTNLLMTCQEKSNVLTLLQNSNIEKASTIPGIISHPSWNPCISQYRSLVWITITSWHIGVRVENQHFMA